MDFDFFSLWFIYYPVSGILWVWHKVFGTVLGSDNGFAWALSVIFMTFTVRLVLLKPFISQMRSMRKMQEFQPQIKKLQEKYKNDRQKLAEEMQKLQREHGVNPLGGCLPLLVQLPVFIGLFHVLRGFRPEYPYNYFFDRSEIQSFLNGNIFGVRLDEAISGSLQTVGSFDVFGGGFNPHVMPVAIPLMIVSAIATHFTARVSVRYQSAASAANPQAAVMQKLTMWVFPIGVLVFGALLPVAILLYWLSNNTWTLVQQALVYRKIAHEEEQKREIAREQRDNLAPRPGQKPQRDGQRGRGDIPMESDGAVEDADESPGTRAPTGGDGQNGSGPPASGSSSGSPGKVGGKAGGKAGGSGTKGSGRSAPGKVGSGKNNGQNKNGQNKGGPGKNGQVASAPSGKRPKKKR